MIELAQADAERIHQELIVNNPGEQISTTELMIKFNLPMNRAYRITDILFGQYGYKDKWGHFVVPGEKKK